MFVDFLNLRLESFLGSVMSCLKIPVVLEHWSQGRVLAIFLDELEIKWFLKVGRKILVKVRESLLTLPE
ncbi:hypothetical protein NIES208_14250 [[Limnothrix rosea] IAM M-220]|nr:hypothetical protein NIES208_14250 [[Limnothrix rosea] IAM M-220]